MQKETKLEEILRLTLESLQKQEYSTETLLRYQKKFNTKVIKKVYQHMQKYYSYARRSSFPYVKKNESNGSVSGRMPFVLYSTASRA